MAEFVRTHIVGSNFDTTSRYIDLQLIGMGTSGVVCSATDNLTQKAVAIKKVANPFIAVARAKETYREISLLKHLRHENVIKLSDVFISPYDDIYLVTERLSCDLQRILRARLLDNDFAQYFLYQILRGLKYVHSAGVIHRDLKPSNILVDANCDVKICDFSHARLPDPRMTGYVTTRYYRAPEIMLTWQMYGIAVDIWSSGCIFAEMIEGTPLFPGRDHVHQFSVITELLGSPPDEVVRNIYSSGTLNYLEALPKREKQPLSQKLRHATPDAINLLERMLDYNPATRISANDALSHPYLARYHDPTDEPVAEEIFNWPSVDECQSSETWRHLIYSAVTDHFNSQLRKDDGGCWNDTSYMDFIDIDAVLSDNMTHADLL